MKFTTSSNTGGSKVTGFGAMLFLSFGLFLIYLDPTIIFMWVWTSFMLVGFCLWLFSYFKKHKWFFEVTTQHVMVQSPFMPKLRAKVKIDAISEVKLREGDTVSGKIYCKNGEVTNIPSPCLPKIEEIANCLKAEGITVYLNNKII